MKLSKLQELLAGFDSEAEVRILIDGKYHNIEEVQKGRFFATVELTVPQTIAIEQAEGELFNSYYANSLTPKREELIAKTIGAERVEKIKKEVDKVLAQKAKAEAAEFEEDILEEEIVVAPEIEQTKPEKKNKHKKKKDRKKMSKEELLLAYFSGDENLTAEEAQELRKALGPEKVKEIFNKAAN